MTTYTVLPVAFDTVPATWAFTVKGWETPWTRVAVRLAGAVDIVSGYRLLLLLLLPALLLLLLPAPPALPPPQAVDSMTATQGMSTRRHLNVQAMVVITRVPPTTNPRPAPLHFVNSTARMVQGQA
jgi:hypothetical protein